MAIPVKAVAFGAVAIVAGLLLFSRSSKAAEPTPEPPPPLPKQPPPPPPPPGTLKGECGGSQRGVAPGVAMSLATAQAALNQAGSSGTIAVDGKYGDQTWAALVNFQNATGLPTTGCLDQATEKALGPYVVSSGGGYQSEMFIDQNGVPWKLWQPNVGGWRGEQQLIQTSTGDYVVAYPDESPVLEAFTKEGLKDRIRSIANKYES